MKKIIIKKKIINVEENIEGNVFLEDNNIFSNINKEKLYVNLSELNMSNIILNPTGEFNNKTKIRINLNDDKYIIFKNIKKEKEYFILNVIKDNYRNIFRPLFLDNLISSKGLQSHINVKDNKLIFLYYINDYTFQLLSIDDKLIIDKIEDIKNRDKILDMIKYCLQYINYDKKIKKINLVDYEEKLKKRSEVYNYNMDLSMNNNLYYSHFEKEIEKLKKKEKFINKYKDLIINKLNINPNYIFDLENNYGLQENDSINIEVDLRYRRNLLQVIYK